MQKSFLAILTTLVLFSLNSAVFAGGSLKEPCPPGSPANMHCAEQNQIQVQNLAVMKNTSSASKAIEKKGPTPEEIDKFVKDLVKAQERDHDPVVYFTDKSLSESCSYATNKLNKWLVNNPNIVIDKKDFMSPMPFKWGHDNRMNGCSTVIVVHYHKIIPKEVKKKTKKTKKSK